MLDKIKHEATDQENRQHLGLEGRGKLGPVGNALAVCSTKLAGAVDRRGAHQVAHRIDVRRLRLFAPAQTIDDMIEQAHRTVRAGNRDLGCGDPSGLLQRDILRQAGDVGVSGQAIEEGKGRVPSGGDHPVGTLFGRQIMGKGDKAVAAGRAVHGIYRIAHALSVNLEGATFKAPVFGLEPPQQHPHERQPRLVERSHPRQPHYGLCRAQGDAVWVELVMFHHAPPLA